MRFEIPADQPSTVVYTSRPFGDVEPRVPDLSEIPGDQPTTGYDARRAYQMAIIAGWAYADGQLLADKLHYYGFRDGVSVEQITVNNEAMLLVARAHLIRSRDGTTAILAFRGTQPANLVAWLGNADTIGKTIYGGSVHHGFFSSLEALWDYIDSALHAAMQAQPPAASGASVLVPARPSPAGLDRPVELRPLQHLYVTGHSLGGAMAVLAAAKIFADPRYAAWRPLIRGVYTFGQPRVGDAAFAEHCGKTLRPLLYRHEYRHDVVPALPPGSVGHFVHFGQNRVSMAVDEPWHQDVTTGEHVSRRTGHITVTVFCVAAAYLSRRVLFLRNFDVWWHSIDDHAPQRYIDTCKTSLAAVAHQPDTAMDRVRRTARTWAINTASSAIYVASGGRRTLREGHYDASRATWTNWSRTFECQPRRFETPTTEEDIGRIVRDATRLRVVAAGHSFNTSPLSADTMLCLDRYDRVVIDTTSRTARAQAGIRLHHLMDRLAEHGLALPVLGSHNRQSIGGLLATDLHGTGRNHGYLSDQVLSIRVVDAGGHARTFRRGSREMAAVIGGIGACGVITEVELQCEPAFNLRKSIEIIDRRRARDEIDGILARHDHTSFYYISGADVKNVRMNLWQHTRDEQPDRLLGLKKMGYELLDMAMSGYLLGLARVFKVLDTVAYLGLAFFKLTMDGRVTVYPSPSGFSRTLYYHHDEIEYGVPYETHAKCLDEVLAVLRRRKFVAIVEVRFTPPSSTLIGPGAGRRTCFIEIAPSLSVDDTSAFAEVETVFRKYRGQPHLGKKTSITAAEMAVVHGDRWTQFQEVRRELDPTGKFQNDFVARVLGPIAAEGKVSTTAAATGARTGSWMASTVSTGE